MGQAGATISYNTEEFKNKVMKFALACALTPDCIDPPYELHPIIKPNGKFDIHYCDGKVDPHQPFKGRQNGKFIKTNGC